MARVRAARASVMTLQDERVVLFNCLAKTDLTCSTGIFQLLAVLADWRNEVDIAGAFPGVRQQTIWREIEKLAALHAVVIDGEPYAEAEEQYLQQWEWGALSGLLHFALKDNSCIGGEEAVRRQLARARNDPSPPLFAAHGIHLGAVALPRVAAARDLLQTMAQRRTNRTVREPDISLTQLSDCLFAGLGITAEVITETGRLPLAMTPSGGARNPYEAYVYARNIRGLAPGFYHYSASEHSLLPVGNGEKPCASALLGDQGWADVMPCIIFLVAFFERTMWKYDDNNGYRVVLIEAGHIAQNVMLAATAHGLSACPTAALSHSRIHGCIGLEGAARCAVYALTLSVPGPYDAEIVPLADAWQPNRIA